ncbi:MAG: hypothetical protein IPM56_16085 [Ignavibacteriales bacterium]|nr:MAG: hypothetical protein IPM56_16085 [Ignavibacteriales bacterium]
MNQVIKRADRVYLMLLVSFFLLLMLSGCSTAIQSSCNCSTISKWINNKELTADEKIFLIKAHCHSHQKKEK